MPSCPLLTQRRFFRGWIICFPFRRLVLLNTGRETSLSGRNFIEISSEFKKSKNLFLTLLPPSSSTRTSAVSTTPRYSGIPSYVTNGLLELEGSLQYSSYSELRTTRRIDIHQTPSTDSSPRASDSYRRNGFTGSTHSTSTMSNPTVWMRRLGAAFVAT